MSHGFLLDTNVLSETRRSRADAAVLAFVRQLGPKQGFLSVLTLGELRKGAAALARRNPQGERALTRWIDAVEINYRENILEVNLEIAGLWGQFSADRTRTVIDTLLAATAIHHGLTLVTRNVRDLEGLPVEVHNPWLPEADSASRP